MRNTEHTPAINKLCITIALLLLCSVSSFAAVNVQTNQASMTPNQIVTGDSGFGVLVKSSGKVLSTDGTLSGNSDNNVPSEKAVKSYVDAATFDASPITNAIKQTNQALFALIGFLWVAFATSFMRP